MIILRGGHDFFLLGFRGGLSKISSYVEEGIRGAIEKSMKSSITVYSCEQDWIPTNETQSLWRSFHFWCSNFF